MDIRQLKNFIEIVESDFNISETSKKIHISQPALSKMIINFEREENVQLFERHFGRLQSLTPAGENFYYNALELIKHYEEMMEDLRNTSEKMKGKIKIGIPPLVNTVLFTEVLPKLILENLDIQFDVVESGAFQLQKSLILQEIDLAVLLRPTDYKKDYIQEVLIADDNLSAFMSKNHELATRNKLSWSDLNDVNMAIFSESFMIHHYLVNKFEKENIRPNIKIISRNWEYLLNSTENTDLITVLPSPSRNFAPMNNFVKIDFDDPINWEVILCRQKKSHYTRVESFVFDFICDYFNKHSDSKLSANKHTGF